MSVVRDWDLEEMRARYRLRAAATSDGGWHSASVYDAREILGLIDVVERLAKAVLRAHEAPMHGDCDCRSCLLARKVLETKWAKIHS